MRPSHAANSNASDADLRVSCVVQNEYKVLKAFNVQQMCCVFKIEIDCKPGVQVLMKHPEC